VPAAAALKVPSFVIVPPDALQLTTAGVLSVPVRS
jgi:hypothetical protein